MEVIGLKKEHNANWCNIQIGQCFVYADNLYIKTPENNGFNSVCLHDGELEYFSNEEYLEIVSARVVVR